MTLDGMDVDAVRALLSRINEMDSRLARSLSEIDRDLDRLGRLWKGPDADRFKSDWVMRHKPQVRLVAEVLKELFEALKRNSDMQANTSAAFTVATVKVGPHGEVVFMRHDPYTSSEPASREQLANFEATWSSVNAREIRKHYPSTYARLKAWADEIHRNPSPSAAEVASFQQYSSLVHVANINRSTVSELARISADCVAEGEKAHVEALLGGLGWRSIGGDVGKSALEGAANGALDYAKGSLRGGIVDIAGRPDPRFVVAAYDQEADSMLNGLYERARERSEVSVVPSQRIVDSATSEYRGRLETIKHLRQQIGAFAPMVGNGTLGDSISRGVIKTTPIVGPTVQGTEIAGNVVKTQVSYSVAVDALREATLSGMSSLRDAAVNAGLGDKVV